MLNDRQSNFIRNIGIIAHIDAGKTTLTERILYYTGRTHKIGEVHNGEATMDFLPEEQDRGITIMSAVTTCSWKNNTINIIDTPGHVDFTIEVERSLRVLDGAVGVFCAVGGVQPQSETVWRQANRYQVPKIIFVNKIDRIGANFDKVIQELKTKLSASPLVIARPYGQEENFKGVLDILNEKLYVWAEDSLGAEMEVREIPEELKEEIQLQKIELIETVAENDDVLMEAYLNEAEITINDIEQAIRRATISLKLNPVYCGAALRNKGVQPLLDAIISYLPAPNELKVIKASDLEGNPLEIELKSKGPLAALVFKIQMMEQGRKMSFVRLYSGKMEEGNDVLNVRTGKKDKIARILKIHAGKRDRVKEAIAGDLVGIVGLRSAITGDTITDFERPLLLEPINVMEPVISVAVEPETSADLDKLADVLGKLAEEDPTFKSKVDADTGQTIISGMGELHLEVLVQRLKREFNLSPRVGKPQVVYRETITKKSMGEGIFDRDHGGQILWAKAVVNVEPLERGSGYVVAKDVPKILGQELSPEIIEAAFNILIDAENSGPFFGYPMLDLKVTLKVLETKEGELNEAIIRMATAQALREALNKAEARIMEPIMRLEINSPNEFMGEIIGDVASRNGKIEEIVPQEGLQLVVATMPMAKLFGYSTAIRSQTQGRGTFSMQFSHYDLKEDE